MPAMKPMTRSLKFTLPMMRGHDVLAVQRRLRALKIADGSLPDGLFGPATDRAVRVFQQTHGLKVDGVVGPLTLKLLFQDQDEEDSGTSAARSSTIQRLRAPHQRFSGGVQWSLMPQGIDIDGQPPAGTEGEPETVGRIWDNYGDFIRRWSAAFKVPSELIVATICTESGGDPAARRNEPGFTSDAETPHRVSIGLMQTLISTARSALNLDHVDGAWLLDPDNSIRAGTAYIASQSKQTLYDPPVVACAYNAGSIYRGR